MGKRQLVFVGTYTEPIRFGTGKVLQGKGKGIYIYGLDSESGALDLLSVSEGISNPSYLAFGPENNKLYAVNELKKCDGRDSGCLSSFAFNSVDLSLKFLNKQYTGGTDPCHVAVDRTGRFAAVANFMSGSISLFPILPDGRLGEAAAFFQHRGASVDPARQAGPHAHSIIFDPSNRFLFVPDLGLDALVAYRFDSSRGCLELSEENSVKTRPGAGPRYMEFHPSGKFAYAVNELSSSVAVYAFSPEQGSFSEVQSISTLPRGSSGQSSCADLHVSPSGKFLFASNRGHDSIVCFRIDEATGMLSLIGHESTRGKTPRSFAIDGKGGFLLAANQDSDSIAVFRIDGTRGGLEYVGINLDVPTPVCVKIRET